MRHTILALLLSLAAPCTMRGQSHLAPCQETPEQKAQRMEWFDHAKLGIFIHWGIYAVNGIRVPVSLQHSGSSAILPLSTIPSGVYVLSVNGRTSKFTKR